MLTHWHDHDIDTRGRSSGQVKTLCPKCSHARRQSRDRCLSVNLDLGVWHCHHCGWEGGLGGGDQYRSDRAFKAQAFAARQPRIRYKKPDYQPQLEASANERLLAWFASRGIPAEVVERYRIEVREAWFPQTGKDERCIAFPYFRDGEVVNVKYRSAEKHFRMEKDAELCLYGLDDIIDYRTVIVVEGELDKLALDVAGYTNAVSVPNGAGTNLDILAHDEAALAGVKRFVLAGDADEAGRRLQSELIRRLGPARCWRVEWPEGCKDANEVLLAHGAERIVECIESARAVPIEGAFEGEDLRQDIVHLYENGRPRGEETGWSNLTEFYRPRVGNWTVVTGIPSSGKSSFVAALLVNLAMHSGWQFVVYPPENLPPEEYASMLVEIYTGEPFNEGLRPRMTRETLDAAIDWVHEHFVILNPSEGERDVEGILKLAESFVLRRGVKGLVIDPWNELEHLQPTSMTATQYVGHSLIKIRNFSKAHGVHTWIVAHPTKLTKNSEGQYSVPTLYDIADSAHWRNKCDAGIVVWRDMSDDTKPVQIHVQKIRWRWSGRLGMTELYFDKISGRYSPTPFDGHVPEDDSNRSSRDWHYRN